MAFGSLSPREAWIEIRGLSTSAETDLCRFPRGKRGLKYIAIEEVATAMESLPPREAWIEILVRLANG